MKKYTFKNGDVMTSELSAEELTKRLRRLDTLRVMMEGYDEGSDGRAIHNKAYRAYNKTKNFTGIIRLNNTEKDFLHYQLESEMITDEEIEVVRFYCGITDSMWNEIISIEGNEHLANR